MNPESFKFFETFLLNVEEKRKEIRDHTLSGCLKSYEEYRHATGKLRGLDIAVEQLRELASNFFGMNLGIENGKVFVIS